ncbi:MAG: hypothetical protein NE328_02520 [Lentisphaeraceae bacterium]|nr:hypothetical protein [Lentisphaeraceae bacterium]
MRFSNLLLSFSMLLTVISSVVAETFSKDGITINTDYKGANMKFVSIEGDTVTFTPDLKGGRNWFYWSFEISSTKSRDLTFVVQTKQKYMGMVAPQGPAISLDLGDTWDWLGAESTSKPWQSFKYTLEENKKVRLSTTIPYMQRELDSFIAKHKNNKHFKVETLATTNKGRKVELVTIGEPGEGKRNVLFTCRHHACETMASFVLEGFMSETASESDLGKQFRDKYVLYSVPIVDKDGVQEGDQGKNRPPHDHNRDYIDKPLYPEVAAIKKLSESKKIDLCLDWHCPTLTMDIHQAVYFVGPKDKPVNNHQNVTDFAANIKSLLPKKAPAFYRVAMKEVAKRTGNHFSDYFASKERTIMSATLEFPYAPKGKVMDGDSCRSYGVAFLKAWMATEFTKK